MLKEYGIKEEFLQLIDESITRGEERILNQIGIESEVCDRLDLQYDENGPVYEIKVFYDRDGVRALRLTLSSGDVTEYGQIGEMNVLKFQLY